MFTDVLDTRFLSFILVSALLIMAPGPDMALVTRNALAHGRQVAWITALGVSLGLLVWAAASVAGIGILLERSVVAFTVLKFIGAIYLAYLGVRSLLRSRSGPGEMGVVSSGASKRMQPEHWSAFKQGLLGNLLNPKAAVIWVSILPQFVRSSDSPLRLLLMLVAFEAMALTWLTLYGYLVSRAGESRAGLQVRRLLERVTGIVLIGLGFRLAMERR